jgi:hypothetical protein
MKKVNVTKAKQELDKVSGSDAKKTIIINNIELYNDLIEAYKDDPEQHNIYIIYQLNGMIIKQMNEMEKLARNNEDVDDDTFKAVIDAVKKSKTKTVTGFVNKKDDYIETR